MRNRYGEWRNLTEEQIDALQLKSKGVVLPSPPPTAKKRAKYGNVKTGVADSGKESRRAQELRLLEQQGVITELCLDKRLLRYALVVSSKYCPDGFFMGYYTADASYKVVATGEVIVEDTKSPPTRKLEGYVFRIKLMKICHNIVVREV